MDTSLTHHKEFSDQFVGEWPRNYRYLFPTRIAQAATQINIRTPDLVTQSYRTFCVDAFLDAVKKYPVEFKAFVDNYLLTEREKERQQDKLRKEIEETLVIDAKRRDQEQPISRFMGDFSHSTGGCEI